MPRSLLLAAYDVRDDARLRRILKAVKSYSSGGQKSAHECWLAPSEVRSLLAETSGLLESSEDRFALVPIDPRRGVVTLGCATKPADPDFYYFG